MAVKALLVALAVAAQETVAMEVLLLSAVLALPTLEAEAGAAAGQALAELVVAALEELLLEPTEQQTLEVEVAAHRQHLALEVLAS